MKNIIKRGTSLLLVLAMLLSFAAVVGAEEPTTTQEKILTLTVDSIALEAGQEAYIPVYETVAEGYSICSLSISAVCDNPSVTIEGIFPQTLEKWNGVEWEYDENAADSVLSKTSGFSTPSARGTTEKVLQWSASGAGFKTSTTRPLCFVKVRAAEDMTGGSYQITICDDPTNPYNNLFSIYVVGTVGAGRKTENATINPGTLVVYPKGAKLPTVILTQSSFAAPTMATYDPGQGVDLLNYLKIVDKDGNLHDASSAADTSITGNYVSNGALKLTPTSGNSGNIIVNNLHAADDASITASATLNYTVTKDTVRTPWRAGFSTYNGKYKTQADFDADFAKNPPKAPAYGGAEHNSTYVNPNVFDQYGAVMEGYSFVPLVTLYDAADHTTPLANEAGNADPAYSAVYFNYNEITGKWASSTLYYTKELKKDVWCKIELGVIDPNGEKANIPADTLEFLIQSQYPQAASATVVLGDMNGNEFPSGPVTTIDIPYGPTENKTFSIIVKDFRQANGETMPEGTAPSAEDVTIALDGPYTGVSINGNKLVIDKTAQAGTVTVKATLNGKELGTLTLTLQKAASKVTELKLYDSATGKPKDGTEIEIKSGVTNGKAILPGIRANDELVLEFEPVCAIDQYGDIVQTKHAVDGGYANRDYLSTLDYVLYKYDETAKEYKTFTTNVVRTVDTTTGVLKLTLKNELDKDTNELLIPEGKYCLKTWANSFPDCKTMLSSAEFELVKGASVYDTLEVTADETSVKVPYAYGTTEQMTQQYLTLTVNAKDQYGRAIDASKITELALDTSTVWVGGSAIDGILPVAKDQHTTTASNVLRLEVLSRAGEDMKTNLTADLEVTLTFKVDGTAKRIEKTKVTTLTKDESVLSTAAVRVGETAGNWNVVDFYSNVMSAKKEQTVNLIAPKDATKSYKISILNCDQYGTKLDGQQYEVTAPEDGSIAIVDQTYTHDDLTVTTAAANKELVISFPNAANPTWTVTIKVVPMEFVKSETGKNDTFQLSDYLDNTFADGKFSSTYDGRAWENILSKKTDAKVYIKTAEGNNTLIDEENLSLEVTKDGAPVDQTQKANAGTYKVKLVYTDENKQTYTVDEKTFTITPKTVKITVNGTITKEYNGSPALPAGVKLTIEGNPADLTVDPNALQYASADASTTAINIVLAKDKTTCLTGDAAANYNVSLDGLTGTIAPRKLIVTPKPRTFEYGENDKITAALASEYTTNINELPTTCVAPTIEGSMVLQKNGEAKTIYNADTYDVANGLRLTGASAGNYEIQFTQGVQWTINRKLLTKVIGGRSSSAGFGITAEGCIENAWNAYVSAENVTLDEALVVSDFVNKDDLSFPSNTVVTGPSGKQYPVPGHYMLNVTKPTKKEIGKNYRVNEKTVYEFNYTVNQRNASDLIVTLTKADGSTYSNENPYIYNGQNQTPTAKVTYEIKQSGTVVDTLDLTSRCKIEVPTQAIDAGSYSIKITSDLLYSTQSPVTVPWKIDPKRITDGMFTQKSDHPVYDGTEQTLTGGVLDGKDSGIQVNGENKVLQLGTDFTAAEVKGTNADEYTMKVSGKGNYTGTADVKVKIDKYKGRVYTEIDKLQKTTVEVTRGQSVEYEILTDVVLHEQELVATLGNEKNGKIGYQIYGDGGNMAGIENPRIEVTGDKKLLFKATVTNQVEVGRKFRITFENSLDNENIKSRSLLTIYFVVTEKPEQENFQIVEGSEGTYSYSQGGLQLTTTGSEKGSTVSWSSSNTEFATVDNTGKVTFVKPTTTAGVIITATASETSAPNALFKATERTYRLTITKGQVMITASSATMTANDPLPGFSATASGLNPNDSVSEVFQTLTASAATDGKTAGTFRVTPNAVFKTGVKDWNEYYELSFVQGTLTVNPAVSVIDTVLPTIIAGNGCANGYANCACESFYDLDASRWYHEAIDWAYSLGLMNGTTKSTFGPNAAATRAQTWTMLARIAGQDTRRSSTWYEVGQKWAMNLGITDGTNPMGSLTREQLAAMLYRYVGSPAVNGTLTFTDSANVSTWARNAMIWAVQNGILDGVGGNRLNPKGTTTRAQAAAIFMRFSKLINK